MTAFALDDTKLAVGDELLLFPAVAHGEEHVIGDGHHEGSGRDAAQRRGQVTLCRLTSPRCHFHAMQSRSFGSIGSK